MAIQSRQLILTFILVLTLTNLQKVSSLHIKENLVYKVNVNQMINEDGLASFLNQSVALQYNKVAIEEQNSISIQESSNNDVQKPKERKEHMITEITNITPESTTLVPNTFEVTNQKNEITETLNQDLTTKLEVVTEGPNKKFNTLESTDLTTETDLIQTTAEVVTESYATENSESDNESTTEPEPTHKYDNYYYPYYNPDKN